VLAFSRFSSFDSPQTTLTLLQAMLAVGKEPMNQVRLVRGCRSLLLAAFALSCLGFTSNVLGQNADLGISKGASSSIVVANTDVTYDVAVNNFSGQTSTPTNTLTDTVPVNMTFVSALYPDGWTCITPAVGGTGTITCTYESAIQDESSFIFQFVFHVNSDVPNGTVISNTATISHAGSDGNSVNDSSTANVTVGTPPPPPLAAHEVLISEFRFSGPGGNSDEFIELYCNRDTDCDLGGSFIRAYDPSARAGDPDPTVGDFSYSFPPNTIIPARHYLLIADLGGYSLPIYASPDFNVNNPLYPDFFVDNEGLQLIGASEPIILDSVGFIGGGNDSQYIEGTGLIRATSRPADQYAYVRKRMMGSNGLPQDTDNNAADFVLVSVTGNIHFGPGLLPPVLGAPGPQGLNSPRSYSNTQFPGSLVEPLVDKSAPPNRVRVGSGDSGTLSIRRTITNNTNENFNYIRFRVIDITTLNTPNTLGDQAELRLITSGDAESFINSQGRSVVIKGTILEYESSAMPLADGPGNIVSDPEPQQPNGGGLNSSVYANLGEDAPIVPGETVDVQFLLNVLAAGDYRFYVYVEALPSQVIIDGAPSPGAPRRMIDLKRGTKPSAAGSKKPKAVRVFAPTLTPTVAPAPARTPVRVWIMPRAVSPTAKTQKKKLRLRRKVSTAVRAKAEVKALDEKTPQN
jgi:uncharacterized repeat protein (TIGR01451 family)